MNRIVLCLLCFRRARRERVFRRAASRPVGRRTAIRQADAAYEQAFNKHEAKARPRPGRRRPSISTASPAKKSLAERPSRNNSPLSSGPAGGTLEPARSRSSSSRRTSRSSTAPPRRCAERRAGGERVQRRLCEARRPVAARSRDRQGQRDRPVPVRAIEAAGMDDWPLDRQGRQGRHRDRVQMDEESEFITRSFTVAAEGHINISGMQIIGWDPVAKAIRSWTFDSDGGFPKPPGPSRKIAGSSRTRATLPTVERPR